MTDEYSDFFDKVHEIAEDAMPSDFNESHSDKEDGDISYVGSFMYDSADEMDIPKSAKGWIENIFESELKAYYDHQETGVDSFAEYYELYKNGGLDEDAEMDATDYISSEIDISTYVTISVKQDKYYDDIFEITVDCAISSSEYYNDEYIYGPVKITCYPKESNRWERKFKALMEDIYDTINPFSFYR